MDKNALNEKLRQLLEEEPNAILATLGSDGWPVQRWMTPTVLQGQAGSLYAVTASSFPKIHQIESQNKVSWLFTSPRSREVLSVRGRITIIDNPRFKAEILEELGRKLGVFWKLNDDPSNLVVLETAIVSAEHFDPRSGRKTQYTA